MKPRNLLFGSIVILAGVAGSLYMLLPGRSVITNHASENPAILAIDTAVTVTDEEIEAFIKQTLFDTSGLWQAPVHVLSADLLGDKHLTGKNIRLTFINATQKKVSAIRFTWYGVNAFGEPADMGNGPEVPGIGGGFTDKSLSPGKTGVGTWSIKSASAKKVLKAWSTEVMFADGTKWKIGKK